MYKIEVYVHPFKGIKNNVDVCIIVDTGKKDSCYNLVYDDKYVFLKKEIEIMYNSLSEFGVNVDIFRSVIREKGYIKMREASFAELTIRTFSLIVTDSRVKLTHSMWWDGGV